MKSTGTIAVAVKALLASVAIAPAAFAQGAAAPEAKAPDEIIVTATRRAASVQDIPVAVTVLGGEQITRSQYTDLRDIQYLAPSVKFQPAGGNGNPAFYIRGIGTSSFDIAVDQSVSTVVDDVVQLTNGSNAFNSLVDVDRIEVLRGPQGTLFGKNSTAGVISINTKRPVLGERSDQAHIQYGSLDEVRLYNILNVPVGDHTAVRLTAAYRNKRNIVYNALRGGRANPIKESMFSAKVLTEPTDDLSIYVIADYQRSLNGFGDSTLRSVAVTPGTLAFRDTLAGLGIVPGPENYQNAQNVNPHGVVENYGGQLNINYAIGDHNLTSITAYRKYKQDGNASVDLMPALVNVDNHGITKANQFTQEIRLASPKGTIEYIVGAFYAHYKSDATSEQTGTLGLPVPAGTLLSPVGGLTNIGVKGDSLAGFAEGTFHVTDTLRILAGGRYSWDKTSAEVFYTPLPGVCQIASVVVPGSPCVPTPFNTRFSENSVSKGDWSGRVGVQFDVTPDVMAYATASRGYKKAALSTLSGRVTQVNPETVNAAEFGVKSQFFDHRLTINAEVYYMKFKDFQAQAFDTTINPPVGGFNYKNAGSLKSKGFDVEIAAQPIDGLSLGANVSYVDAKYSNFFPACPRVLAGTASCFSAGNSLLFNASGLQLINAPKWSFTLRGRYEAPLTDDLKGFVSADYAWRDDYFFQIGDPGTLSKAYGLLNTNIGLADVDNRWRATFFVRNLLDKHFVANIGSYGFAGGIAYTQAQTDLARRTVGVSLDFNF